MRARRRIVGSTIVLTAVAASLAACSGGGGGGSVPPLGPASSAPAVPASGPSFVPGAPASAVPSAAPSPRASGAGALPGGPSPRPSATGGVPTAKPSPRATVTPGPIATATSTPTPTAPPLVLTNGDYPALVLHDSPLAYYRMNDRGATMVDSQTSHIDGRYGAADATAQAPMTSDAAAGAVSFPGGAYDATRFASAPRTTVLQPAATVTLEAWIRESVRNTTGNYETIVAYGRGDGNPWQLKINPQNTLYFTVFTAASPTVNGGTTLVPGVAYHVVGTFDGTTARLYLNGALEGSASGPGALVYTAAFGAYGLAVGGDEGTTRPQFAGAISNVAIYGTALSAAQVARHYLVGHPVVLTTERAVASDAFVDTIGVVTHFGYQNTCYENHYQQFKTMLLAAGIRHIRAPLNAVNAAYYGHLADLAASGVRATMGTNMMQSANDIVANFASAGNALEAFEGPNEPDVESGDAKGTSWIAPAQAAQRLLWNTVKGDARMSGYPVYGIPLAGQRDYAVIGDQSAYLDAGNMHDYFGSFNPGTAGYGSTSQFGTVGSIAWQLGITGQMSGSRPVVATETGWGTKPGAAESISYTALGKYVPRLFLEHFKHGVPRTLIYEFCDHPTDASTFSYFGLVRDDMTPKPAYNALKGMIAQLSERGASFAPATLTYAIGGNTNNVEHLLMQKSDGSYWLALWQEVRSWDPSSTNGAAGDYTIAPENVTVSVAGTIAIAGNALSFDAGGNPIDPSPSFAGPTVTVPVGDAVTLVHFRLR